MKYKYNRKTHFYDTDDPVHDLWLLFTNTRYAIFRIREKELLYYDLSPEQAAILFLIQNTKATIANLSRHLLRQPQTVSSLVKRMEEKGLLTRVKDPDNLSKLQIVITDEGKKAYELTRRRTQIHSIMNELDTEEQKNLNNYMVRLYNKALKELKSYDNYWSRT